MFGNEHFISKCGIGPNDMFGKSINLELELAQFQPNSNLYNNSPILRILKFHVQGCDLQILNPNYFLLSSSSVQHIPNFPSPQL